MRAAPLIIASLFLFGCASEAGYPFNYTITPGSTGCAFNMEADGNYSFSAHAEKPFQYILVNPESSNLQYAYVGGQKVVQMTGASTGRGMTDYNDSVVLAEGRWIFLLMNDTIQEVKINATHKMDCG
jgi:hypothetical protein